jgi:hypothetical protein
MIFGMWVHDHKGGVSCTVMTFMDTPPYGHAPTYQISFTYLKRQKCYGPDKNILFKNQLLTLRSKFKDPRRSLRYATHRLSGCMTIRRCVAYRNDRGTLKFDLKVK